MHSLKTKINVINDEQNVNILTKVIVKRQVTGGRQMRAVLLKVWRIPLRTQGKLLTLFRNAQAHAHQYLPAISKFMN